MWFICHLPGILCVLVIYSSFLLINWSIITISSECLYHLVFFEPLALLILVTHLRTACTNPGTMPSKYLVLDPLRLPSPFSMILESRYLLCNPP